MKLQPRFTACLFIVLIAALVNAGTLEPIMRDAEGNAAFAWMIKDDAELIKLAVPLKRLAVAWLNDSQVTDAGVRKLASLTGLKRLNLCNSKLTDAGVEDLAGFQQLEDLYLGFTQVTDDGIKDLVLLKQLKTLDLTSTRVTDAGLNDLSSLTQLQTLFLNETRVSEAGLAELRRALPSCRILPFVFAKKSPA
jgi:Leucine Rich Repeat (LRR) protein